MADVKILLVEDESIEAMDIKHTLESFGYEVPYVASSGEEAVEKALEIMPDLILMDIILKGEIDGIETVSKIKDLNIPVIYLTAHSEESTIERAKLTVPYGYIIKPYDRTELKYAIELAIYKNQMEKELKESEKKFYLLFENSPLPYQSLDENGFLLDINPAWLDILGYTKDEVIGKNFADFLAPGYTEHFNKKFPHFKNTGEIHEVEFEMKHKDGSHILISYEGKIGYDELGNFKQTHCIFHDITKQKKAEKALKVSENKYHAIFDNAGEGIFLMRGELIIECNEKSLEIYKVTLEQIIGQTLYDFSPELQQDGTRSKDRIIELINKALDGYPQHFNWKHLRYDGVPFYSEITLNRVKIENEYLVQAMVRDVTEREEAKKVLRESEQRLMDIINFLPDATFAIDLEGKVIAWNNATEKMTGTLKKDIIGKGNHAYAMPWYGERRPILIDLIKPGTPEFREKYEYIHKQGKTLYAEVFVPSIYDGRGAYLWVTASPLLNSEGEQYGAIESVRDITERKKAEISLKKSAERFRAVAESAIDAIVTTDENGKIIFFNNSLTKIFGYTKEDLTGKPLTILMPTRYQKNYLIALQNFKESGKHRIIGKTVTTIGLKKDKSEFPFEMSLSTWKSEQKTYFTSIIRDLSERQKAEIALKESEEKFRAIAENAIDAILIAVEKGKHVYVNPKAVELTGYSKEELLNTQIKDLAHPDEIVKLKERYNLRMAGKHIPSTYETRIVRKDNEIVPIEISAAKTIWIDKPAVMVQVRDITSRKKIEEKLKWASIYNRSLIEASLDPLVTIGPNGKINDVNKATETVTGYSKDELIGSVFSDYFTEPVKAKEGYRHVFMEGFVRDYPLEIQHKDGHVTPVLYNASVYRDESGNVVGVFAAARDITEYKKAVDALRESEGKYRDIFEESFDGLFITSPEGKILDMNKKGIEMFGYNTKEEVLSLDLVRDVYADPNDRKKILAMVNEQGSAEYEVVVKKKNGNKMITRCSLTVVKDKGVINTYRGIVRDITESKKAENDIIRAKEEWENTFDAVPDLIAILDTNFRVVRANKAMADRLGVSSEEAVGLTCYDVVHGLNSVPSFCPYSKLLEDGQEHTAEVHEDRLGGDFIVSVSPLHDKDGKLIGVVHVARDITKRKKTENEINKSLEEKEVLLREIHHRVKNNLQIIASLLHLQELSEDENEIVDVLKESEGRVKSMAMIHEKLYQSPSFTYVNFKQYIEKLVYDILYTNKTPTGTIKTNMIIEEINLNIDTAIPLGLIVNELVTNSVKHAFPQSEGTITIELKSLNEQMELIIADDGIGLPKKFDLEKTERLGLKIVNSLVNQLDGKINIDMTVGTEFKINFKEVKYKERI